MPNEDNYFVSKTFMQAILKVDFPHDICIWKGWGGSYTIPNLYIWGDISSSKIVHFYTNVAIIVIEHLKSFSFVGKLTILIDWPLQVQIVLHLFTTLCYPYFWLIIFSFVTLHENKNFIIKALMILNWFLNFNCSYVIHTWCCTTSPCNCNSKE